MTSSVRCGARGGRFRQAFTVPREASALADYPVPPRALVLTEGAAGGRIETGAGTARFAAPAPPARIES
ncbi:MAG TPA: hypothetical protein VF841_15965, partial [Anaeromyxobacter sp.]